jgi:hypothetical protein
MPPPLVSPSTATAAQSSGGGDPTEEDAVTLIDLDDCVVTPAPVRTEAEYRACVAAYDADLVQRLVVPARRRRPFPTCTSLDTARLWLRRCRRRLRVCRTTGTSITTGERSFLALVPSRRRGEYGVLALKLYTLFYCICMAVHACDVYTLHTV